MSKRVLMTLSLGVALCGAACDQRPASGGDAAAPAPESLVNDKALVAGHLVAVAHSKWDGGRTADLFDADPQTLARTENANPAVLEFRFPEARPLKGISITLGGVDFGVSVTARPAGGGAARNYEMESREMGPDPTLDLEFDTGETPIASLRVEILDLNGGDGHIHIRTVKLLQIRRPFNQGMGIPDQESA